MTDSVIGKGVIEVSADTSKLQAGFNDGKKSINAFGREVNDAGSKASKSIDNYIKRLETQQKMMGMNARETEAYKLSLRGASDAQLKAADSAIKLSEAYQRGVLIGDKFKAGLIAASGFALAAAGGMVALTISSINAADHLNDLSKTTGISIEQLAGLRLAAKQSGSDLDGVAASVSKLSQNIGKDGEKFAALGITAKDPLEAFKQLADIFVAIDDPQTRAALGAAALGKSWQSAAPLLAEGSKSIGEMVEKGTRLSGVTQQLGEDSDKFNDSLEELKAAASGAGNKIAGQMLPGLTDVVNAVKEALVESGKLQAVWVALGGLGAFLFTDEFSSTTVKVKNLKEELSGLVYLRGQAAQREKNGGLFAMLGTSAAEFDKQIADTQSKIKSLLDSANPKPAAKPKPITPKAVTDKVKTFIGGDKTKPIKDTARQEAKAQLISDLDQIKLLGSALTDAYSNSQKILEAGRAADLVNDRDYYAAKLAFINLNADAEAKQIEDSIARMRQENLAGKDKINNDRKIADAEAQLQKVRENAAASATVATIQQVAANTKVEKSYADARAAAQAYLDTVKLQNARDIAAVGRGDKFNEQQAGLNTIDDKFTEQRQKLEQDQRNGLIDQGQFDTYLEIAKDTYAKEVAAFEKRNIDIDSAQADWTNGAAKAMENYYDTSQNVAKQTADLFTNSFQDMEDALVDFVKTGKLDFKSLADSIISQLIRIQIKSVIASSTGGSSGGSGGGFLSMIISAVASAFGSGPGMSTNSVGSLGSLGLSGGRASGGPVSAGNAYLVGEKGPEILQMGSNSGTVIPNNALQGGMPSINYAPVIHIDSRTDRNEVASLVDRAVKNGNAMLVDKLQRAGRL